MKFQQKIATVAKSAKFAKFQNVQVDNLVDFEKMLQNAYLLAKIGVDTAENERHFAEILPKLATTLRVAGNVTVTRSNQAFQARCASQPREFQECRHTNHTFLVCCILTSVRTGLIERLMLIV